MPFTSTFARGPSAIGETHTLNHGPRRASRARLPWLRADGPVVLLARLIVLFWAVYFTPIAVTNTVDLLERVGAIHWTFLNSGNFDHVRSVVRIYHVGSSETMALLAGALVIEGLRAALFWRAMRRGAAALGFAGPVLGLGGVDRVHRHD